MVFVKVKQLFSVVCKGKLVNIYGVCKGLCDDFVVDEMLWPKATGFHVTKLEVNINGLFLALCLDLQKQLHFQSEILMRCK